MNNVSTIDLLTYQIILYCIYDDYEFANKNQSPQNKSGGSY